MGLGLLSEKIVILAGLLLITCGLIMVNDACDVFSIQFVKLYDTYLAPWHAVSCDWKGVFGRKIHAIAPFILFLAKHELLMLMSDTTCRRVCVVNVYIVTLQHIVSQCDSCDVCCQTARISIASRLTTILKNFQTHPISFIFGDLKVLNFYTSPICQIMHGSNVGSDLVKR